MWYDFSWTNCVEQCTVTSFLRLSQACKPFTENVAGSLNHPEIVSNSKWFQTLWACQFIYQPGQHLSWETEPKVCSSIPNFTCIGASCHHRGTSLTSCGDVWPPHCLWCTLCWVSWGPLNLTSNMHRGGTLGNAGKLTCIYLDFLQRLWRPSHLQYLWIPVIWVTKSCVESDIVLKWQCY